MIKKIFYFFIFSIFLLLYLGNKEIEGISKSEKNEFFGKSEKIFLENKNKEIKKVKIPVFMYHYIVLKANKKDKFGYNISTETQEFEDQMKILKEKGFETISVYDLINKNFDENKKYTVLTFDDGYVDFYDNAFPILKKYGFKGTVGIITSKIGKKGYLNENQIIELKKYGIEIVSHSVNHKNFTKIKTKDLDYELAESKDFLEKKFNINIQSIIYPSGKNNSFVLKKAKNTGYLVGFTTVNGFSLFDYSKDNLALSRYRIDNTKNLKLFASYLDFKIYK